MVRGLPLLLSTAHEAIPYPHWGWPNQPRRHGTVCYSMNSRCTAKPTTHQTGVSADSTHKAPRQRQYLSEKSKGGSSHDINRGLTSHTYPHRTYPPLCLKTRRTIPIPVVVLIPIPL